MSFQVGDKVWSPAHGDGVVAHIEGAATEKPVRVSFVDMSGEKIVLRYREDGRRNPLDVGRSIFHAGSRIVEAPEPDRKPPCPFKPFDKVLVRSDYLKSWIAALFSHKRECNIYPYVILGGHAFTECISFEGNEHLLGTTNSPEA